MSEEFMEPDQVAVGSDAGEPDGNTHQPEEKDAAKKSGLAEALLIDDNQIEGKPEAPEKYELNTYDSEDFDGKGYADVAKHLGLSQEAAQKIIDAVLPTMEGKRKVREESQEKEFVAGLEAKLKDDNEIGGVNLDNSLRLAAKAVKKFNQKGS